MCSTPVQLGIHHQNFVIQGMFLPSEKAGRPSTQSKQRGDPGGERGRASVAEAIDQHLARQQKRQSGPRLARQWSARPGR